MTVPVVRLAGISKTFPDAAATGQLGAWWRALRGVDHARGRKVLQGVGLQVAQGEAVAVLGENGAGKTTLLKLIAGVLVPTEGTVEVQGRIGALLELGAGFQPELTGRQNLRNACVLAGLTAAQLPAATEQIINFSQLQDCIDQPLKHYSSGMVVRLGFAVMTAVNPQLLISDEVLAVGDEAFQKKCIAWVEQFLANGGSLLLVSHSIYHVQKLCERAIWLHQGRIREHGDVFTVSQAYLGWHEARLGKAGSGAAVDSTTRLTNVTATLDQDSQRLLVVGELHGAQSASLAVELRRTDGALVATSRSPVKDGSFALALKPSSQLLPGRFRLEVWPESGRGEDAGHRARCLVQVEGQAREFGCIRLPHRWLAAGRGAA